jgi:hypothetical protein
MFEWDFVARVGNDGTLAYVIGKIGKLQRTNVQWCLSSDRARSTLRASRHRMRLKSDDAMSRRRPTGAGIPKKLFSLDIGRPDDRPPFLDLGLLKCTKRLRTQLIPRRDFLSQFDQSLPQRGVA